MSSHKILLRDARDGSIATVFRKLEGFYAIDPDTNRREFVPSSVCYQWPSGEGLNTADGKNFTSLAGDEYTLIE